MGQQGFQLDLNLCTGCQACVVACAIENERPWDASWRSVESFNTEHAPGLPLHHLSLACNHCADAPCATHCPALAYDRDPSTGAVLLDPDRCIGCKYCSWACPYDAPSYDASQGVMSKCTFCNHRLLEGLQPACVTQCPTSALQSGELQSLRGTSDALGFPVSDAQPSIRFVPLRDGAPLQADAGQPEAPGPAKIATRVSLRGEAPLLIFSLLSALLAGIMSTTTGRAATPFSAFFVGVALAAAASSFHLGHWERAWRAVLNWRRSWLSREILCFSLFAALGALHQLAGLFLPWLGFFVGLSGFALLFSIDRVYDLSSTRGLRWHSASALPTGLLVAGVVAQQPWLWAGAGLFKLVSYSLRKRERAVWIRWVRGLALVAGGLLLAMGFSWAAALPLALGEIVDRVEFYLELDFPSPSKQTRIDWLRARSGEAGAACPS